MSGTSSHSERLAAVAVQLRKANARPSWPKLLLAVFLLSIGPLIWTSFAVNSFLSNAPLATKMIRLQNLGLTEEFDRDVGGAWTDICQRKITVERISSAYADQFAFFNPVVLLGATFINSTAPSLSYAADTFYRAIPVRPDFRPREECQTRYLREFVDTPRQDLGFNTR